MFQPGTRILLLFTALALGSCDTYRPPITLPPGIYVGEVQTVGLIAGDSAAHTLAFTIGSSESLIPFIIPGTWTPHDTAVAVGETFTDEDLVFEDTVVYPSPDVACVDDTDCAELGEGFTCQALNPSHSASSQVCGRAITMATLERSLRWEADERPVEVVLALHYGATILGVNPVDGASPPVGAQWRSDPSNISVASADAFGARAAEFWPTGSSICVGSFDVGPLSMISVPDPCTALADHGDSDVRDTLYTIVPTAEFGRGVYQAALDGVALLAAREDADRHVVILTDGPDQSMAGVDLLDVVDAAVAADVAVHMIHLDHLAYDEANTGLYPGPIGAQRDLADVAYATGGTYVTLSDPLDAFEAFDSLADHLTGHYEVDVLLPELASLAPGPYRVATTLDITLHDQQDAFEFRGDMHVGELGDLIDGRLTVFVE